MKDDVFIELGETSLDEWRNHPVTAAFLQWVALAADRTNYECAGLLRQGLIKKAQAMAGKSEALESIIAQCHRKDAPPEAPEEEFRDPVYRFDQGGHKNAGTE